MRNWDPGTGDADAQAWLQDLADWREAQREARDRQIADRRTLDAAEDRVGILADWLSRLDDAARRLHAQAVDLAATTAALADVEARLAVTESDLAERREARETATARLLAGPGSSRPLVLLPLRVHTSWSGTVLRVRVYPDDIAVDRHEPRLTAGEQAAAAVYWATRQAAGDPVGQPASDEQAWRELVRRTDAQRAAWIVRRTDPAEPPLGAQDVRDSPWDLAVRARLLPDRFAVVAFAAGEPVDLAPAGRPARFVTWAEPVADPLPVPALQDGGAASWATDLAEAVAAGMAVAIDVPASVPPIEELVVVGVRTGPGDLADLLDAHAFSLGLEVLADGASTNNSASIRAAHSARRDSDAAAALVTPNHPTDLPDGTAGAELADLLGVPRPRLAAVAGAAADRQSLADAVSLLVGLAATGPLLAPGDAAAHAGWSLLRPHGAAPTLRVGRQPYGVLPASVPGRWVPRDGAAESALAGAVRQAAHRLAVPLDVDPADPPAALPAARAVRPEDVATLDAVLSEAASSLAWRPPEGLAAERRGTGYAGLDALVGPADGDQSPAGYLARLATAAATDLDAVAATLPDALLARVGLAARRRAAAPGAGPDGTGVDGGGVVAALGTLARLAARPGGRDDLARSLTEHLDAASHRTDAWVTAAATARLLAQQHGADAAPAAIGGYGYVTDVRPRSEPRSHGHVHAPSLAHAVTAAVLRAGYLGQRRAAWAAKVLAAEQAGGAGLAEARAGLAALDPLDDATESRMPLAIDVSSRRVRDARRVLAAVRAGQPLAVVLGYQVERDLADRGLQQYLAAFRKLTRFHAGTALQALEEARRSARQVLAGALDRLATLQADADQAADRVRAAREELARVQDRAAAASSAAAAVLAMQTELGTLDGATIPQLRASLSALDAARPTPAVEHRPIRTP